MHPNVSQTSQPLCFGSNHFFPPGLPGFLSFSHYIFPNMLLAPSPHTYTLLHLQTTSKALPSFVAEYIWFWLSTVTVPLTILTSYYKYQGSQTCWWVGHISEEVRRNVCVESGTQVFLIFSIPFPIQNNCPIKLTDSVTRKYSLTHLFFHLVMG